MAKKYSQTSNTNFKDPVAIKREFELRMKNERDLNDRLTKIEGNFPIQFPKQQDFRQELTSKDYSINIRDNKDLSLWNYSATMHRTFPLSEINYKELINRHQDIQSYPILPRVDTNYFDGWIPFGCYSGDDGSSFKYITENYNKNWLRFTSLEKIYEHRIPPVTLPAYWVNPLQKRYMFFQPCPSFTGNNLGAVYDVSAKVVLQITPPMPVSVALFPQYWIKAIMIIDRYDAYGTGLTETTDDPFDLQHSFYNALIKYDKLGIPSLNSNSYAILDYRDSFQPYILNDSYEWDPRRIDYNQITIQLTGNASVYLKSNRDIMSIWYKIYVVPIRYEVDPVSMYVMTAKPSKEGMATYLPGSENQCPFQAEVIGMSERLDIRYSFRNQYVNNPYGGGSSELGGKKIYSFLVSF